jgi:hypothetical protein
MTPTEIKTLIKEQLPQILAEDLSIRDFILRTISDYYAPKQETESKFDRILAELKSDREKQDQKWEENNRRLDQLIHEQNQKWDEQNQKWKENNRRLDQFIHEQNQKWDEQNQKWWKQNQQNQQILEEIKKVNRKHDSTIGALGSRWGLYSEASFRNALGGILQDSFGVEVLNINDYDEEGIVFGSPDQVEIDVIIKNGLVIVCEIKSSMSKSDMYIFNRKVEFYQKRYQRNVNRKIVISPMVNKTALPVAEKLEIEIYSYAEDVTLED